MQRLLHSSKFWAAVLGLVTLVLASVFGPDQVKQGAENAIPIFALIAPIILAALNAFEDIAEKVGSGEIDLSDGSAFQKFLIELIKEVLAAMQEEDSGDIQT